MRRTSSTLVLLVLLGFGLALSFPAEDVPETLYDESEAQPYEDTPLFSSAVMLLAARTAPVAPTSFHAGLAGSSPFTPAAMRDVDTHSPANARSLLALFCMLLC
jgi:hypothetical protein